MSDLNGKITANNNELSVTWHSLSTEETLARLDTPLAQGLTTAEAQRRLAQYGPNQLLEKPRRTYLQMIIEQLRSFVIILLLGAAILSAVLNEPVEAIAIIAIVLLLGILITSLVFLLLPSTDASTVSRIRDVFIILIALESLLIGLVLIILIVQLARLTNLLQNEIKPILDSTNETVSTLRGTTTFLSTNLVEPVIKLNQSLAALHKLIEILGIARKRWGGRTPQDGGRDEAALALDPDSVEAARNRLGNLDLLRSHDQVKIVVCSRADYEWARDLLRGRAGLPCQALVSPSWGQVEPRDLAEVLEVQASGGQ